MTIDTWAGEWEDIKDWVMDGYLYVEVTRDKDGKVIASRPLNPSEVQLVRPPGLASYGVARRPLDRFLWNAR